MQFAGHRAHQITPTLPALFAIRRTHSRRVGYKRPPLFYSSLTHGVIQHHHLDDQHRHRQTVSTQITNRPKAPMVMDTQTKRYLRMIEDSLRIKRELKTTLVEARMLLRISDNKDQRSRCQTSMSSCTGGTSSARSQTSRNCPAIIKSSDNS